MEKKNKNSGDGKNNNTEAKQNSGAARRKKLLTAVIAVICLLAVLFVTAEYVLPAISSSVSKDGSAEENGETRIFYDNEPDEQELSEYEGLIKHIYYKKDGVETLVTDGSFYEIGGNAAVMFSKYIDAIKNGDETSYAECFSEKYDSENGLDRFASGTEDFPPQRLYDIHIESLDERYDEASGLTLGLFCVTYRIWHNTGDFRSDIGEDTAPLIFTTEELDGKVLITDITYRYGA